MSYTFNTYLLCCNNTEVLLIIKEDMRKKFYEVKKLYAENCIYCHFLTTAI